METIKYITLTTSIALHMAVILPFIMSNRQADSAVFQSKVISLELALGEAIDDEITESAVAQEEIVAVEKTEIFEQPVETVKVIDETAETIDKEEKKEEVKPAFQQEAMNDMFEKKLAGVDFGVQGGGMTNASYGANVKKIIEKNKKRPPDGLKGNVKIGFLIGSKGKVESTWIVNSTNEKLNSTAEIIINSISTLSPPEDKFTGVIEIKFD